MNWLTLIKSATKIDLAISHISCPFVHVTTSPADAYNIGLALAFSSMYAFFLMKSTHISMKSKIATIMTIPTVDVSISPSPLSRFVLFVPINIFGIALELFANPFDKRDYFMVYTDSRPCMPMLH